MEQGPSQPGAAFTPTEAGEAGRAETKLSGQLRFAWVFAGVVLPVVCFGIDLFGAEMQGNSLSGWAMRLLSRGVSLPLFPLLLICMASLVSLACRPAEVAEDGWVRLGIFSGVVLSMEYWLIFQTALSDARGADQWWAAGFIYGDSGIP